MSPAIRHALSNAAMTDARQIMSLRANDRTEAGARMREAIEARVVETARAIILADSLGSLATASLEPQA